MGKPIPDSPVTPLHPEAKSKLLPKELEKVSINTKSDSGCRPFQPPDGGWGWMVCFASFWINGTIFGVMNCFGVLYVKLKDKFGATHDEAAFVTSWVGSVSIGMTFLLSPVASILTDKLGIRKTAFLGGFLATAGMLISSFVSSLELLYLTYGVLLGSGASLAYTPSLVVLGHYFHRRLGLVNGLVTAGSSAFTMAMPHLLRYLLDTIDLAATLQILSLMMGSLMLCSLTFRPLLVQHQRISDRDEQTSEESLESKGCCCTRFFSSMLDTSIWKNKMYLLWVFAIPTALFGYFVPYVHLVQHVKDILPDANGELLVTCIGFTSGVGRIVFGILADFPFVNRIFLQQLAFVSIGVLTMVLVVSKHFIPLIIICLFLGLFDGCFISLLGPIAFDVVGHKGASQAIGFLLGFCSIPLTVGPPVAGLLYDHMKNYTAAFLAAGVPPIIGAFLLCFIRRLPQNTTAAPQEEVEKGPLNTNEKSGICPTIGEKTEIGFVPEKTLVIAEGSTTSNGYTTPWNGHNRISQSENFLQGNGYQNSSNNLSHSSSLQL